MKKQTAVNSLIEQLLPFIDRSKISDTALQNIVEGHLAMEKEQGIDAYRELPSVDEAGIMAVKISEMAKPPLTAQEQSFFIAGFCECMKWLSKIKTYENV